MWYTKHDNTMRRVGFLACLILLAACVFALGACTAASSGSTAVESDAQATGGTESDAEADADAGSSSDEALNADDVQGKAPYYKKLKSILGKDVAQEFVLKAASDPDRYWIAANLDAFDNESPDVREKLLRLAADEDAAVPFVREYAERYPSEYGQGSSAAIDEDGYPEVAVGNKNVPHLYQWDQRWGYTVYSSAAFGLAGCAPTALAMAYQATMLNDDLTPYDVGVIARDTGYMDETQGTYQEFPYAVAESLGMYSEVLPVGSYDIEHALSRGYALVANMKTGYFSHTNGHFIVLCGMAEDGKIVINDPYSVENSKKTWDIDFIVGETMMVCGFANPALE